MAGQQQQGWILGLVIFIMGGCGIAYEYTFSKIASDLLGNSVQQWAIIIALMLFCMGVGAEIQRFITQARVVSSLLYSQLALALLGGFGPFLLLFTFSSFPHQFGLVHYGIITLMGIFIGFEIPLITRINEEYSDDIRSNLARVLKMDYIGALIGALVWIFLLPKFFDLHQIAYVLAFLSLSATILCWFFLRKKIKHHLAFLGCLIATVAALSFGFHKSKNWSLHAEQGLYHDRVVYTATTPYQHIVLTESHHGTMRCYINGHIQFSSADEYIYHENLVHPAMQIAKQRRNILVLGGGDGLAVREILKYPEVSSIVLVDLDKEMTRLASEHPLFTELNENALTQPKVKLIEATLLDSAEKYKLAMPNQRRIALQNPPEAPELHVINIDAVSYLNRTEGVFDVIICDFPDPSSTELAKLYSLQFYGELKKKLAPGGVLVQQSTSPYRAKEAYLCIGRTMQEAGFSTVPLHDHVPSFGEWGWWIATHSELKSEELLKKEIQNISSLTNGIRYLTPELIHSNLVFGKEVLSTTKTDITTITHSAVLQHYLSGWQE